MKKTLKRTMCAVLTLCTVLAPVRLSAGACEYDINEESCEVLSDNVVVGSRIKDLLFGKKESKSNKMLVASGDVFGVKLEQRYVTVTESARIPALKRGDVILSVNGKEVRRAADVQSIVSGCGGSSVTIRALHGKEKISIEVLPSLEEGEYKLGLSLRDGALGIGTITFIDPETGAFGGLGHGICDADSGEVIDMRSGEATGVILGGVHRGECGKPGELCGILTEEELGTIEQNGECGVFGVLDTKKFDTSSLYPVGQKSDVHAGEATIISTVKNGKKAEYKIEIFDIDKSSDGSKSFRIKVTDKALKALTGGIVRGMSGSPIIQDGKLVGAVTHVMVANPTEGYGIFIENMLNASNARNELPKAA